MWVKDDDSGGRCVDSLCDRPECLPGHLLPDLAAPIEAGDHFAVYLIDGTAADGVVGVILEEVAPGAVCERFQVWGFGL